MPKLWVLIKSWHIVSADGSGVPRGLIGATLCGRTFEATATRAESFEGGKTCESCLRIEEKHEGIG